MRGLRGSRTRKVFAPGEWSLRQREAINVEA